MRAEDKRKLRTPDPESIPHQGLGCYLWLSVLLALSLVGVFITDSKIVVGLAIAATALAVFAISGYIVDRWDIKRFGKWAEENNRFAVVVTSDSPKWAAHINDDWLGKFGDDVSILNYSQKREWPKSIESKSVEVFSEVRDDHPIVIIPRRSGRPAVYRFHAAFVAASHGDDDALKQLEERLFKEYDEWRARI